MKPSGLSIATATLVFTSFLALTSTSEYGLSILWLPLIACAFMPIGERLDARFPIYRKLTTVPTLAFILLLPVLAQRLLFLDAVVVLVIFVQIYSMLHAKQPSRYGYIFLMSFFLLLAASVMSPKAEIGLVLVLFAIASLWMLMQLEIYRATQGSVKLPAVRLRHLDRRDGQSAVPERATHGIRLGGVLAGSGLLSFLLMILFFISIPRTEAGLMGASDDSKSYMTGINKSVSLEGGGDIVLDYTPVMQVSFPDEPGGRYEAPMFWRARALDDYTGTAWEKRQIGMAERYRGTQDQRSRYYARVFVTGTSAFSRHSMRQGRKVRQEIFIDRAPDAGLPALDKVFSVEQIESGASIGYQWDKEGDFAVYLSEGAESGILMNVVSEVFEPDPDELRKAEADFQFMATSEYMYMTLHNLKEPAQQLARRLTDDEPTLYDKMLALETYLRSGDIQYTRVVPALPSSNPIDAFLMDFRRGHCQLFASSMALMARSMGVPTRIVSGYRGATWNDSNQSYLVTQDRAHVWVEVLFPEYGWIAFDPSPADSNIDSEQINPLVQLYSRMVLNARLVWMRDIVGYRPRMWGLLDGSINLSMPKFFTGDNLSDPGQSDENGTMSIPIPVAVVAMLLLACLILWRALKRGANGRGQLLSEDQLRAQKIFREARKRLTDLDIDCNGKTAEELIEAAESHGNVDTAQLREVLAIYEAARFGRGELSKSRGNTLRGVLKQIRLSAAR